MSISIIGTYNSKFGKLEDKTIYDLIVEAGKGAIEDSKISAKEIDEIWVGNFSAGGFNNQEHIAAWATKIDPNLRYKPCTRTEVACASGAAAVKGGMYSILAKKAKIVLVIGVEKMCTLDIKGVTKTLAMASYWPEEGAKGMTFPGLFAKFSEGYQKYHNYSREQMDKWQAMVAVKNHSNAMKNPLAQMHREYTLEFASQVSDKNPMIAPPLKLSDCSLVSDGAAALVLVDTEIAKNIKDKVVEISSLAHVNEYLPISDRCVYENRPGKIAVQKAYKEAGVNVNNIKVAEVHDCFTINEMLSYEAMGLCKDGEAGKILEAGDVVHLGGRCPVNLSGGLKAKGHPVGATGVSMHVLIARQLIGEAIGIQAQNADIGLVFNVGGANVTNIVSILKRVK